MLRPRIRHLRVSTRDSPHANSCLDIEPDPNMYVQYFHNPARKSGKDVSYTYTGSRVVGSTQTKRFDYTHVLQGSTLLSRSTHIYIASPLHSYSINSVLHLLSPTYRDSYEPGYAYCIAKLLKFTHSYLPSLWPLYRSLTLSLHVF
jgi:hypothetical protein